MPTGPEIVSLMPVANGTAERDQDSELFSLERNYRQSLELVEGTIVVIRIGEILPFAPPGLIWKQLPDTTTSNTLGFCKYFLERIGTSLRVGTTLSIPILANFPNIPIGFIWVLEGVDENGLNILKLEKEIPGYPMASGISRENYNAILSCAAVNPGNSSTQQTTTFNNTITSFNNAITSFNNARTSLNNTLQLATGLQANIGQLQNLLSSSSDCEEVKKREEPVGENETLQNKIWSIFETAGSWHSIISNIDKDSPYYQRINDNVIKYLEDFKRKQKIFEKEEARQNRKKDSKERKEARKIKQKNNKDKRSWFVCPIGIEYTYHIPEDLEYKRNIEGSYADFSEASYENICDDFGLELKAIAENFGRSTEGMVAKEDAGPVLEIVSPIHKTWSDMVWWFDKIEMLAKKYNLKAVDSKRGSGGGHINISFPEGDDKFKQIFFYNLVVDTCNRPYLAWMFNDPNDCSTSKAMYENSYAKDIKKETPLEKFSNLGGKSYSLRFNTSNYNHEGYSVPYYFEIRFFESHRNKRDLFDAIKFVNSWIGKLEYMARKGIYIEKDPRIWNFGEDDAEYSSEDEEEVSTIDIKIKTEGRSFIEITNDILEEYSTIGISKKTKNKHTISLEKKLTKLRSCLQDHIFKAKEKEPETRYTQFAPVAKKEFSIMLRSLDLDPKNYNRFVQRNFNKRIKFPYGKEYLV